MSAEPGDFEAQIKLARVDSPEIQVQGWDPEDGEGNRAVAISYRAGRGSVWIHLEPDEAREIAVALVDAATGDEERS